MAQAEPPPQAAAEGQDRRGGLGPLLGPLLALTGVFFLNFISRVAIPPLLPSLENSLGLSHAQAGSLFIFLSAGYFSSILGSGFISCRLGHRRTIILSGCAVGAAMLVLGLANGLWGLGLGLLLLGLASGPYLPSAMATITHLAPMRHWGKALAVHELAPNLGFVLAPLLAAGLLEVISWSGVAFLLGAASLAWGLGFARWGQGGDFPGQAPDFSSLRLLAGLPAFWAMIFLFSLGLGGTLGIYSMLPLYLTSERGMDLEHANLLVALSRVICVGMAFLSGWATDHLGPRQALAAVFSLNGLLTIALGASQGGWLVFFLFVQPMVAVCFFPAGFAALSRIGPASVRPVAISMTVPPAYLLGGGALPAGIAYLGEAWSFGWGIALTGGFMLLAPLLLIPLRLNPDPAHN